MHDTFAMRRASWWCRSAPRPGDDALVRGLFDRAERMDCDVVAASTN